MNRTLFVKSLSVCSNSLNIFKLYFLRFMRITPALAAVLFANYFVAYFYLDKSPYLSYKTLIKTCEDNWWAALLHVQNYVHADKMVKCLLTKTMINWRLSLFLSARRTRGIFQWTFKCICWHRFLFGWSTSTARKVNSSPLLSFRHRWSTLELFSTLIVLSQTNLTCESDKFWFTCGGCDNLKLFFRIGMQHKFFRLLYFPTHVRGTTFLIGIILGCYLESPPSKSRLQKSFVSLENIFSTFSKWFLWFADCESLCVALHGFLHWRTILHPRFLHSLWSLGSTPHKRLSDGNKQKSFSNSDCTLHLHGTHRLWWILGQLLVKQIL